MTTAYEWARSLSDITCEHITQLRKQRKYSSLDLPYYPKSKRGKKVYVCVLCKKPLGIVLILYREECDCGEFFSSPWEPHCEKCHRIEFTDFTMEAGVVKAVPHGDAPPYWGWAWLSERLAEGRLVAQRPAHLQA